MSYSPLAFVEALSFVRYGGTPAELQAAKLIQSEIERAGGTSELMEFQIPVSTHNSHCVKVTAPYEKELVVTPFGICGSVPAPGKELKFFYAENCSDRDLLGKDDLSEYVVMINTFNIDVYKRLCKRNAGAILVVMGKYYHDDLEAGIYARNHRPKYLEFGCIPTFYINANQATELVRNDTEKISIVLDQTDGETTSQNVLSVIEGSDMAAESVVLTAHYDSLSICDGAWDNATGSAALMGLYHYFMENRPRRTMRFIWCGSEEQGLLGSRAYVEQNEELLSSIKFCFNFDMCGTVLGSNQIFVTGSKALETFVEQFCRETGYSADIMATVHSSDSAPFADKGIPAIGLSRGTQTSEIHTVRDQVFTVGEKALCKNIDFFSKIISRVVNAVLLPVDPGMPDDMKDKIDKYFMRDK